jgi:ABC-2 type transport system ATP-binding protein
MVLLVVAGCSSNGSDAAKRPGSRSNVTSTAAPAVGARTCDQKPTLARVESRAVPGTPSDLDITSFDGAEIRTHWFPLDGATKAKPAPTILMGPGWSLPGDTSENGAALFGAASIKGLHTAGYNVLTWDPRGFGKSGGTVTVDDPMYEGRDVQVLLDWIATQPEAQLDRPGDPRSGMVGFSYGGGIQLAVAAKDCRIDALVPGLAWHSLQTSLLPQETYKVGWSNFLSSAGSAAGKLDPHITAASAQANKTGTITDEQRRWFLDKGPGDRIKAVGVPTLFVSGTVDTLFPLHEAVQNYDNLLRRNIPTGMVWFCGGHGTCLTNPGTDRLTAATLAWLDRYVKGNTKAKLGPSFDVVDQDGGHWTSDRYAQSSKNPITASGSGTLQLTEGGGAGPLTKPGSDLLGGLVAPFTPAKATRAVEVKVDPGKVDGLALGAPEIEVTYTGTAPSTVDPSGDGGSPDRAYAQLVDDDTGFVVGNQITPFPLTLDGTEHRITLPLEVIAQHVRPGHTLTLQLVATTTAYKSPRLGGNVDVTKIAVTLPMADKGVTKTS